MSASPRRGQVASHFRDRHEAGTALAAALAKPFGEAPVVLALPRGGVPVAFPVAESLGAPLDVLVVRKVGAPGHPEFGIGAVAEGAVRVLDLDVIAQLGITDETLSRAVHKAETELDERTRRYRANRPAVGLEGRRVMIIDDGLATGGTAIAAIRAARQAGACEVVVTVPVASREALERLRGEADDVFALWTPASLQSVGSWYADFSQTSSEEVTELLARAASRGGGDEREVSETHVINIPLANGPPLIGNLTVPAGARGLVIFAHGSGSSRHSPRNLQVAADLQRAELATLLLDLLTPMEEQDRRNVFDIDLLAERLGEASAWASSQPLIDTLPVGLFGASTGGGAALVAAAADRRIKSVVSRGGRVDLAGEALARIQVPVLMIVGSDDPEVLQLTRGAQATMRGIAELAVIANAGHLFEEPGALEQVGQLAAQWFARSLGPPQIQR
jgi:putative phosphoribosyl transferase